ncbi:MAG: hypothetical protein UR81_C0018G0010 [Candidatus Levybacteria bacterium GW2011_GWB1_35_5]|nr:MAG: hypothetical protein UR81_C0018G0010 [Candidatus Levybacteria bacterium GW2011_GWB1_35_5]
MKLTLKAKKPLVSNTKSFVFKPEKNINWTAGQYLIYSLSHKSQDLRGKMRFFTISSSPFQKHITITTKIIKTASSFKRALDNLKIEDQIEAKGPDGDFVIDNPKKHFVFIAGGIGITPFISIIRQLNFEKKPINVNLLYANKTNAVLFKKELDGIAWEHKEFKINYYISPKRIDENALAEFIKNKKTVFYISGPDPMVDGITKLLFDLGISEENIKQDYFSGYKKI